MASKILQVYVDALGNTTTYERYLSNLFPGISFTVTAKADSKYKIVGAASIAAKVTRDAWVTGWAFEEHESNPHYVWPDERGSGYPSGMSPEARRSRVERLCVVKQIRKLKRG